VLVNNLKMQHRARIEGQDRGRRSVMFVVIQGMAGSNTLTRSTDPSLYHAMMTTGQK
jgi:hypothetical protein